MSYKIGSFNCLNFARGTAKDVDMFVELILQEQFDIVALQEIKGNLALDRILSILRFSGWDGIADDDPRVNDYAFIWNTRRIKLAESKDAYGNRRVYQPRIYKQYKLDRKSGQKDLIREPFYARFHPAGTGAPFIEIRIINTHIRYGKGSDNSSEDEQTLGAIAMRKNEFDVLAKAIYAKEADKQYDESRPSYIIMLGDYNLNSRESGAKSPYLYESIVINEGKKAKNINTVQNELTTLKKPGCEEDDDYYSNNYDHFTYDTVRFKDVSVSCGRIDTVKTFYDGDYERHIKRFSDHVPIAMNIDLK